MMGRSRWGGGRRHTGLSAVPVWEAAQVWAAMTGGMLLFAWSVTEAVRRFYAKIGAETTFALELGLIPWVIGAAAAAVVLVCAR